MPPTNQPVPPAARRELTVKQQRDARRAEKVAALKKKQAAEKRNRVIAIVLGSVAVAAVIGLVITLVVTGGSTREQQQAAGDGDGSSVEGIELFPDVTANHVEGPVTYEQTPPAGGDHAAAWLNCGIYDQPVPTENAVHDLEHGAIWVTYNPDEVTGADLEALRDAVPDTYLTMSPWPDLDAPVVASAWGAQVALDGVDDERLQQFIDAYWQSPDAPEPGAACTGGVDAPGLVT